MWDAIGLAALPLLGLLIVFGYVVPRAYKRDLEQLRNLSPRPYVWGPILWRTSLRAVLAFTVATFWCFAISPLIGYFGAMLTPGADPVYLKGDPLSVLAHISAVSIAFGSFGAFYYLQFVLHDDKSTKTQSKQVELSDQTRP